MAAAYRVLSGSGSELGAHGRGNGSATTGDLVLS